MGVSRVQAHIRLHFSPVWQLRVQQTYNNHKRCQSNAKLSSIKHISNNDLTCQHVKTDAITQVLSNRKYYNKQILQEKQIYINFLQQAKQNLECD